MLLLKSCLAKVLAISLSLFAALSCDSGGPAEEVRAEALLGAPVYFVNTPQYMSKTSSFKVSMKSAIEILNAHIPRDGRARFTRDHFLIIGDEYVFSISRVFSVPIAGFYINGDTGTIRYVNSVQEFPWSEFPVWHALSRSYNPDIDKAGNEVSPSKKR